MSSKPEEITLHTLRGILLEGFNELQRAGVEVSPDDLASSNAMKPLIGIVEKSTKAERTRCANVARRKGHAATASTILRGLDGIAKKPEDRT